MQDGSRERETLTIDKDCRLLKWVEILQCSTTSKQMLSGLNSIPPSPGVDFYFPQSGPWFPRYLWPNKLRGKEKKSPIFLFLENSHVSCYPGGNHDIRLEMDRIWLYRCQKISICVDIKKLFINLLVIQRHFKN